MIPSRCPACSRSLTPAELRRHLATHDTLRWAPCAPGTSLAPCVARLAAAAPARIAALALVDRVEPTP